MLEKPYTVYFAKTNFRGSDRAFGIKMADRRQHMYVIGKTGTGKTNLLKTIALQDIENGSGVAIVDPHGEFVREVLARISKKRAEDVIYFDPSDTSNPIGFNVLEVGDPQYKHLVASDLMGIFTKIWANVWSARMEYILSNCILALLDTPGTTLLGIPRILIDKDYRRHIINNLKDPIVRSFWVHEYENYTDRLRSEAIVPIQNKVGQFLSTPLIRNIVGQEKSSLKISEIMNAGKILLVDVSKGRIGEDNSALLGAMIITKIQLAAMERVRIPENKRKDFYLYVDEFQNFATESFASILSEARKYRLNIIVAHQYIGQLVTETSTKVRDAIFGNVGTMIVFRVGAVDAEFLEQEFTPEFDIQDLVNLPNFRIYLKLMVNNITSRPFSGITIPFVDKGEDAAADMEAIIVSSRKRYSRPKEEVEEAISRWSGSVSSSASTWQGKQTRFAARPDLSETRREAPAERIGQAIEDSGSQGKTGQDIIANCWICGKETKLNFQPDGRRPIYCVNCLKKVGAGEIPPASPRFSPRGVEFENKNRAFAITKDNHPDLRKSFPVIGHGVPAMRKSTYEKTRDAHHPLSLQDLPNKSPAKNIPKRVQDLDGLRNILKETLSEKDSQQADEKKNEKNKSSGAKLKPGESVKF